MRSNILSAILAGGLIVGAGAAMAGEPVLLTDTQMDGVNAGATAIAFGAAAALGDLISDTATKSHAEAAAGVYAVATNTSAALAVSTYFGAAAAVKSASAASLP